MARLPFVDTHVHFWDLSHPDLHYAWLQPDVVHPIIGDIDAIKSPVYSSEEFLAETAGLNVSKVVHVEADVSVDDDPVDETIWLEQAAERTGIPTAIVAHVELKAANVEEQIERHRAASPRLRGVRDFSDGDYLVDSDFARGYAVLGKHGLVCDLDCIAENMPKARDLARKHPETTVVLDHAGYPRERTSEYFALWKQGVSALAEAESAWCKISGLGMCDHNWTVDSIRPWFEHCLDAFGVERCVLATNWPIDKLFSSYEAVLDAYEQIISDLSADEQVALFSANAERLFDL
ncbi:MAG TPA: amidohydrolase family protein [Solirubrobacteraceae bacterium]|jgi:predicted TIM-barrel fold metal-dependent hydrolase|nr:amidohydrolase family protein [Solirubrobacteraceae bacterium]